VGQASPGWVRRQAGHAVRGGRGRGPLDTPEAAFLALLAILPPPKPAHDREATPTRHRTDADRIAKRYQRGEPAEDLAARKALDDRPAAEQDRDRAEAEHAAAVAEMARAVAAFEAEAARMRPSPAPFGVLMWCSVSA
jgi:hypothetical protein